MEVRGQKLKQRITEEHLTFVWLISMMRRKGIEIDKFTLSSIVNGTIAGAKAEKVLDAADEIMSRYDAFLRA